MIVSTDFDRGNWRNKEARSKCSFGWFGDPLAPISLNPPFPLLLLVSSFESIKIEFIARDLVDLGWW